MIKITIEKQAPAAGEHFPAAGAFVCLHFCTGSPLDHSAAHWITAQRACEMGKSIVYWNGILLSLIHI